MAMPTKQKPKVKAQPVSRKERLAAHVKEALEQGPTPPGVRIGIECRERRRAAMASVPPAGQKES